MIRKLVLPVLAIAMLGGCVSDYAYRAGDRGDYYYGQPSTEYRYDGPYGGYAPYGGGYAPYGGYSPYGYGGYGYGYPRGYYGTPYGYGGYYNHRHYYPPYYTRPPVVDPRPDGTTVQPPRNDNRRQGWRNFDELRRRPANATGVAVQSRGIIPSAPMAEPRERGSRMEQVIRRANRNAEGEPGVQEP